MFENARLKLQRANHHITNLEATIAGFVQGNRHDLSIKTDSDTGDIAIAVSFAKPIPPCIALIIGDAVHNLKTALDYGTWELIGIDGGEQHAQLYFPSGGSQRDYEATCNGIKGARAETKKFFAGLKNYAGEGGNVMTYGLHLLDRAEKHTVLTPMIGATRIPHMKVINPDGMVIEESKNCSFIMGPDGRTHITIGRGNTVELYEQANTTIEVFLAEFPPLPGPQPALPMLKMMANAVAAAIGKFDEFVRTRTP